MGKLKLNGRFGSNNEKIKQLYSDKSVKLLLDFSDNCVEIQCGTESSKIFFEDLRLVHILGKNLIISSEDNQRVQINIHSKMDRDSLADMFTQFIHRVQGIDTEEEYVRYYWALLQNCGNADDKRVCVERLQLCEGIEHILSEVEKDMFTLYEAFCSCYKGKELLCILTDVVKGYGRGTYRKDEVVELFNFIHNCLLNAICLDVYEAYVYYVHLFFCMSVWVQKENVNEMKNQIVDYFNGVCDYLLEAIRDEQLCEEYGEYFDAENAIRWIGREKFAIAYRIGSIFEMDKLACDMSKANLWYDVALEAECAVDLPEYAEIAYFKANKVYEMSQEERKEWLQSAANKGNECAAYELAELLEANGEAESAGYWKKIALSGGVTSIESAKKIRLERNKAKAQNLEREIRNWEGALDAFSQTVGTVAETVETIAGNAMFQFGKQVVSGGVKAVVSGVVQLGKKEKNN